MPDPSDLAAEVLAEHRVCDGCVSKCGYHCRQCQSFMSNEYPCESARLATALQNAEKVVEAARDFHESMCGACPCDDEGDCLFAVQLAGYDEGGH